MLHIRHMPISFFQPGVADKRKMNEILKVREEKKIILEAKIQP